MPGSISVGSGLETLRGAGRGGEETDGSVGTAALGGDYHFRCQASVCRNGPARLKAERCAGTSTLTGAATTARRGSVMLAMVIFARVMSRGHMSGVPVSYRFTRAMHRAGHNGRCRAAQCRDPWREKNDDEVDGEKAAHHSWQSTSGRSCSRRGARGHGPADFGTHALRAKCPSGQRKAFKLSSSGQRYSRISSRGNGCVSK